MRPYSLFCIVMTLGVFAAAQDSNEGLVLKQIDVENQRLAATKPDGKNISVGEKFVASNGGQNFFFTVSSVKANIVQLTGNHCSFIEKLSIGQSVERSLFDDSPTGKPVKVAEERECQ